ncbi:VapB protein of antitoxin of type II toxin-antitoxin system [Jatrophihabitans sp. GAS493]|uniref:ribbon-helix-helix domain-containing protein n=1 Tax=Jatrophihabitans sp. GAS493 TaxID=1907575 RepID=UPI000BB75FC2|nr:ribbon-helix-helix domain-containing protein [Jatrophihabitans sp. GAS493]SOD72305.1 VapB protein of antitoxin of type II toxin-antitoxin system [Jatrophihabitans sp. GAS493]
MKTTFDLPEPLLREVQELAKQRGTTSKSLVEQALRRLIEDQARKPFVLPDLSVGGEGLQPEFRDAPWDVIRDAAYGVPS